jgi:hypothetical protein
MKALLILIVTVGTSQANVDAVDSSLDVRQIEFASIQSCERAAARLNGSGRSTSDWAKTFARDGSTNRSGAGWVDQPVGPAAKRPVPVRLAADDRRGVRRGRVTA